MDESDTRTKPARGGLWSRRELLGRATVMGIVVSIPAAGTATVGTNGTK